MKWLNGLAIALLLLMAACGGADPMKEVNELVAANKIPRAKNKFKEIVEAAEDPLLEREYILFLWKHKQYQDFKRAADSFLGRNPQDGEIAQIRYQYYAKLASDAERQGNYGRAMDYIIQRLLNPDFKDYKKWESRQVTVLRKWHESAVNKQDVALENDILSTMINLGFGNLAQNLAPEKYQALIDKGKTEEEKPEEEKQEEAGN